MRNFFLSLHISLSSIQVHTWWHANSEYICEMWLPYTVYAIKIADRFKLVGFLSICIDAVGTGDVFFGDVRRRLMSAEHSAIHYIFTQYISPEQFHVPFTMIIFFSLLFRLTKGDRHGATRVIFSFNTWMDSQVECLNATRMEFAERSAFKWRHFSFGSFVNVNTERDVLAHLIVHDSVCNESRNCVTFCPTLFSIVKTLWIFFGLISFFFFIAFKAFSWAPYITQNVLNVCDKNIHCN